MNPIDSLLQNQTRRALLGRGVNAVGWAALSSLMGQNLARPAVAADSTLGVEGGGLNHFLGKAKHVIYLHMVGGPPQMDLYDYKPKMDEWYDKDLP
ncbi:MAG: DUF1501 domain-containing protein, partial [Planctomycetota bacterium]|nr:DUF1501 domain-containing protein [Planctomycetota bacterium]